MKRTAFWGLLVAVVMAGFVPPADAKLFKHRHRGHRVCTAGSCHR